MYLSHHINKDLGIIPTEGMDHVTFVLTREDCLDQGRKLVWGKHALNQAFGRWSDEVKKRDGSGDSPYSGRAEDIRLSATEMVAVSTSSIS